MRVGGGWRFGGDLAALENVAADRQTVGSSVWNCVSDLVFCGCFVLHYKYTETGNHAQRRSVVTIVLEFDCQGSSPDRRNSALATAEHEPPAREARLLDGHATTPRCGRHATVGGPRRSPRARQLGPPLGPFRPCGTAVLRGIVSVGHARRGVWASPRPHPPPPPHPVLSCCRTPRRFSPRATATTGNERAAAVARNVAACRARIPALAPPVVGPINRQQRRRPPRLPPPALVSPPAPPAPPPPCPPARPPAYTARRAVVVVAPSFPLPLPPPPPPTPPPSLPPPPAAAAATPTAAVPDRARAGDGPALPASPRLTATALLEQ